jgi:hypothetical protein
MKNLSVVLRIAKHRNALGMLIRSLVVASLAVFLCTAPSLSAQSTSTGALKITVQDQSGELVPGATIMIDNGAGLTRTDETDSSGSYLFTILPPGDYKVTISAQGFARVDIPAVTVHVSETATLTQNLTIGQQQQSIEVTAQASVLQVENAATGDVVNSNSIASLPLVTRNYLQIMNLSPGVATDVSNATAVGPGIQSIFVNGKDNTKSNYSLNGLSVANYGGGGAGGTALPSPDALQEFTVLTSNYDASYGRDSGGSVNVVTKSGTDEFHGTAFEYFRNTVLNANLFFDKLTGVSRPVLDQNQFGGTVGGPIKKNKLFFFISYQGTRQKNGVATTTTVTLPEQLTNDRSVLGIENAFCAANPNNLAGTGPGRAFANTNLGGQQLTCPSGGPPGQGTVAVPLDTIGGLSSVAYNILNLQSPRGLGFTIPTPQLIETKSGGQLAGLATFSFPAKYRAGQGIVNVDYLINSKHTLALRYLGEESLTPNPLTSTLPNGGTNVFGGNSAPSGKLTSVLSPNLVNEAELGYFYDKNDQTAINKVTATQVGMTGAYAPFTPIPEINIASLFTTFGNPNDGERLPSGQWGWFDHLSWTHGRQTFRMGYDQARDYYFIDSSVKTRGELTYETFADFLLGESAAQNGTGQSNVFNSQASMEGFTGGNDIPHPITGDAKLIGLFFQDDVKVTSGFTLNVGLRWEYDGLFAPANPLDGVNGSWALDQSMPIPPVGGTYVGYTIPPNYNGQLVPGLVTRNFNLLSNDHQPLDNFSPRVGFAWQPHGTKLVLRAGGGYFYDLLSGNQAVQTMEDNPPLAAFISNTGAQAALATNAVPFNPDPGLGSWTAADARTPTTVLTQHGVNTRYTPLTYEWNATLQYAITPSLAAEVAYIGNRGIHGDMGEDFNIPQLASPANPLNCGAPFGCITTNTAANAGQRVPVLGFGVADVQIDDNAEDSNYNSLQLSLRYRMSHGLQFSASYTLGRCFDDAQGAAGGQGSLNGSGDPNPSTEYGPCDYMRPQRLVINYTYQIPGVHTDNKFVGKATSGWTLSGVTTAQDGYWLTPTDSRGGAVYGFPDIGTAQAPGASRAQFCPGMNASDISTKGSDVSRRTDFFNINVFCSVPIIGAVTIGGVSVGGATGYGNAGRADVLGPGQFNFDFSISKKTAIRENNSLEFRAEAFNIFNHPQFGNPAANVAAPSSFGELTSTNVGPRIIQFALRYAF